MRILALLFAFLAIVRPAFAQDAAACKPVATVYETTICESDVALNDKARADIEAYAKKNGQDAEKSETNLEKARLFSEIWETALAHKFGAAAIEPTDKESAASLKLLRGAMKQQYANDKELVKLVKGQLEKYDYAPDIKQKLNHLVAQKEKAVAAYEKRQAMPDEMKAKIEKGEEKVAEAMTKSWKVKKLLFDNYGGAVVFENMDMEPLDASKKFLAELESEGAAKITDSRYADVFKTMEEFLNKPHQPLPADAPEIKEYFNAPGWIYNPEVGKKIYAQVKDSILALPHTDKAPEADKKAEEKKK